MILKVNKVNYIFTDENKSWQFDFSNAIWATDELHEIYSVVKGSILDDVDFIVETKDNLFMIECKNANVKYASKPKALKPLKEESLETVAKKYYDSFHYVRGLGKGNNKRLIYVYIVEAFNGRDTERKGIRNRLRDRLPFKLQKNYHFVQKMIDEVKVLTFNEWNRYYPQFPAKRLKECRWNDLG